jgi:hypothetical protein
MSQERAHNKYAASGSKAGGDYPHRYQWSVRKPKNAHRQGLTSPTKTKAQPWMVMATSVMESGEV